MSNDRFNILAPNKINKDNKKITEPEIKKDFNSKKESEVESEKTNMFKRKPQNKRFSFNHSNDDDNRNNERDSTNNFQYNKNNNNNDNSFRKKRRDNHRRESYFERRKYTKEKEKRKKEEEEAKKFKYKDDDFPSL